MILISGREAGRRLSYKAYRPPCGSDAVKGSWKPAISQESDERGERTMEEKKTRPMPDKMSLASMIGSAVLQGARIEDVDEWNSDGIAPVKFQMIATDFDVTKFWNIDAEKEIVEYYEKFQEDTLAYSVQMVYSESTFYDYINRIIWEE